MNVKQWFIVIGTLLVMNFVHASEPSAEQVIVEKYAREHKVPDLSVGVVTAQEQTIIQRSGDTKRALPNRQHYQIASISKVITAMAVLNLLDQNGISLDACICQHVEALANVNVTFRQLLTHTSDLDISLSYKAIAQESLDRIVSKISEPDHPADFSYNDHNYNLLGLFVASQSGSTFVDYVMTTIIKPLNMSQTFYYREQDKDLLVNAHSTGMWTSIIERKKIAPFYFPSEGLVSTAEDLSLFIKAVIDKQFPLNNADLFTDAISQVVQTNWNQVNYGLGWQVIDNPDTAIIQHAGGVKGFNSLVRIDLKQKRGVVILANTDEFPRFDLARELLH